MYKHSDSPAREGPTRRAAALTTLAIITLAAVIVFSVSKFSEVAVEKHRIDAEINRQTQIERTKIEQNTKLQRTKEHLKYVPWSRDE